MIVFDLRCGNAHVFEAWFGSSADYEAQSARGLIACPLCDDATIGKAAMAPAVPRKGNAGSAASAAAGAPCPAIGGRVATKPGEKPADADGIAEAFAAQRRLEAASHYVGDSFAVEARAMHDGETASRAIHGEATPAEALALLRDGVPVAPLPFRPLARSDA